MHTKIISSANSLHIAETRTCHGNGSWLQSVQTYFMETLFMVIVP